MGQLYGRTGFGRRQAGRFGSGLRVLLPSVAGKPVTDAQAAGFS